MDSTEENEQDHVSEAARPPESDAAAPTQGDAPSESASGVSLREFALGFPKGSFPLLNALRVHMGIKDNDADLRPEAEFAAKLKELQGESDG